MSERRPAARASRRPAPKARRARRRGSTSAAGRRDRPSDPHRDRRVLRRRLGRARNGPQPADDLQGDLCRHRAELVLPGGVRVGVPTRRTVWFDVTILAAFNLQQTLLISIPLDLHRPRGGLRVPLRHVQHRRSGPVHRRRDGARLGRLVLGGHDAGLHIVLAIGLAALAGAVWAGIAGFLKATVGAHEVITTIMLNWIAYWVGSFPFGQGGPLQNKVNESVPVSSDDRRGGEARGVLGRPAAAGPPHRVLPRPRGTRRVLADPDADDARLRGARGGLQP